MNRATRQAIGLLKQARGGAYTLAQSQIDKAIELIAPRKASDKTKATRARVRARSLAKSEKHRMSTKEIRAVCKERAAGKCECGCTRSLWLHGETMDHFLCGNGQKQQKQSVETCWILAYWCHVSRQENSPNAAYWNARFKRHCERYGYPVLAHVEHAAVPRRSA